MRPGTVNERSVCYITAAFYGRNRQLVTPSSIRYRIDDVTLGLPGTTVTDWTEVDPEGVTKVLTVTAEENKIRNSGLPVEYRQVTVEATGIDGEPWRKTYTYAVENLAGTT